MSMELGRNDPCHCGSGKKYKRCHLASDEQRQSAVPEPDGQHGTAAREPAENSETPSAPLDSRQMARVIRDSSRTMPPKDRAEFDGILAQTQPIMAYMERREEIEAAATALEAHRAEFDRFAQDEKAYFNRAQTLFAEDRFKPMWFTAADVRRAFEKVGYPPDFSRATRRSR
jgi:hypothetical protein